MIKSKNRKGALAPLAKKKTISEEVAERIVLAIASGEQMPGDRLTEKGISDAMDISRVPVREALMQLEAVGVLVPTGGRGYRLAPFPIRKPMNYARFVWRWSPSPFNVQSLRSEVTPANWKRWMPHLQSFRHSPEQMTGFWWPDAISGFTVES